MACAHVSTDELFVQLLTTFQRRLYVYVLTILADEHAAEEVLSDVNATLWQKKDEFQIGTSFSAWALKVAYFRTLSYVKKRRHDRHMFNDEFIAEIADAALDVAEENDLRSNALVDCLKKLSVSDRRLIDLRYGSGMPVQEIATQCRKTPNTVSQLLSRIRLALANCIERTMQSEPTV